MDGTTAMHPLAPGDLGSPRIASGPPPVLVLELPELVNEHGGPMRLLLSWLLDGGAEGAIFYSGTGAAALAHPIPPGARGFRLRRWPSEGLAPEYFDWWFSQSEAEAVSGIRPPRA